MILIIICLLEIFLKVFNLKLEDILNIFMKLKLMVILSIININIILIKGSQRGTQLLSSLPSELKNELNKDSYLKILKKFDFLKKHFSKKFIISLCSQVKEVNYGPDEVIFNV